MQLASAQFGLDVASEYLLMAATLAHIKSKMLLPAPPPGQEDETSELEEDPREALIKRLLEYQKYKQAAADLAARGVTGRDVFTRGVVLEEAVTTGLPPLAEVPLYSLLEAFQAVLSRAKVKMSHDVVADRLSLSDRIAELADVLAARKRITFDALFEGVTSRFDLVITFLALLEMAKLRMTRLFQTEPLAPIYVELAAGGQDQDGTSPPEARRGQDQDGTSPPEARRGQDQDAEDQAGPETGGANEDIEPMPATTRGEETP
jgi:segregation and condensation protein A